MVCRSFIVYWTEKTAWRRRKNLVILGAMQNSCTRLDSAKRPFSASPNAFSCLWAGRELPFDKTEKPKVGSMVSKRYRLDPPLLDDRAICSICWDCEIDRPFWVVFDTSSSHMTVCGLIDCRHDVTLAPLAVFLVDLVLLTYLNAGGCCLSTHQSNQGRRESVPSGCGRHASNGSGGFSNPQRRNPFP